jgi:tRNA nucleotidyltransferase/poly(A) polymerase
VTERSDLPAKGRDDDPVELIAGALGRGVGAAWLVGGAVRDRLRGVAVIDLDIVTSEDPRSSAHAIHDALGGDIFSLSDRFGTWRVIAPTGFHVDITARHGETIEDDLARRDFTVNAIAEPLGGGELVDPFGGRRDLAEGLLRMVSAQVFADDPLRLLRLARQALTLGLTIDPETERAAHSEAQLAAEPAAERTFAELRAMLADPAAPDGLQLLEQLGLLAVVLPEIAALKGVEQTRYHHKDAFGHTLEVLQRLITLEADGFAVFESHAEDLRALLEKPLADEMTRGGALRWAALLHDVAKPLTRHVHDGGRVGFPHHEVVGADLAQAICRRLHTSERLAGYVSALTRQHMRLGFLVPQRPLSRRELHRYLVATSPVEVEVGVLSVADRMATRGRKHEESIPPHIELAVWIMGAAIDFRQNPPTPLIRGDQLAAALGIETGPRIGQLLEAIAEAQYAGEIADRDAAIALARAAL